MSGWGRNSPLTRHPELASRTDVSVSENFTVPILGERWSPLLVSANAPAAIWSGHAALRQTEIGHQWSFVSGARGKVHRNDYLLRFSARTEIIERLADKRINLCVHSFAQVDSLLLDIDYVHLHWPLPQNWFAVKCHITRASAPRSCPAR